MDLKRPRKRSRYGEHSKGSVPQSFPTDRFALWQRSNCVLPLQLNDANGMLVGGHAPLRADMKAGAVLPGKLAGAQKAADLRGLKFVFRALGCIPAF